jgi:hypothetical protein
VVSCEVLPSKLAERTRRRTDVLEVRRIDDADYAALGLLEKLKVRTRPGDRVLTSRRGLSRVRAAWSRAPRRR